MDSHQYRLDGWDVGILMLGMAVGVTVGILLGLYQASGILGLVVALAGFAIRRKLSPHNERLTCANRNTAITWTLVPTLVVGIGGLLSVFGVIGLVILGGLVANNSTEGRGGLVLLMPIGVCAVGAGAIVGGIKWARRSSVQAETGLIHQEATSRTRSWIPMTMKAK